MILQITLLVLSAVGPEDDILLDKVDVQEYNHFYDEQGRLVFDQMIYYRWMPYSVLIERDDGTTRRESGWRYQCIDWRLIRTGDEVPTYDHGNGVWAALFRDGEAIRRIESPSIRETWTQYDPELAERPWFDKDKERPKLRKWIDPSKPLSLQVETPIGQIP